MATKSALTGEPLPDEDELRAVRLANLSSSFAARHELLADALAVSEVAELLNVGRQTPHDRLNAGTLVAVKDRGQWRFPAWQFDPEARMVLSQAFRQ
jgi:excisionase family DNA binding protein